MLENSKQSVPTVHYHRRRTQIRESESSTVQVTVIRIRSTSQEESKLDGALEGIRK